MASSAVERFLKRVEVTSGCWIWKSSVDKRAGYARISDNGKQWLVHKWVWEQMGFRVPDGFELDHLCRNRRCVNPFHVEPVTHRENLLRGEGFPARNAQKTTCAKGHPYAGDNLYLTPREGHRRCRQCNRDNGKRIYAKTRQGR